MSYISYNAELTFPNKEASSKYREVLEEARLCYNHLSQLLDEDGFRIHQESRFTIRDRYYRRLRREFPLLTSQMVGNVVLDCVSNWKSAIKNAKQNGTEFKTPFRRNPVLTLDKRLYSRLQKGSIKITIPSLRTIQCTFNTYARLDSLFEAHQAVNCSIFYKNRKFYISIKFDVPEVQPESEEPKALGIDRGIRRIAACSDGTGWINKKFNASRRKLRYLKRCLQKSGTKSAKRHLKRVRKTERNRSRNEVHRVVNWLLAKPVDTYVLEDLSKIKKNTSKTFKIEDDGNRKEVKKTRHNNRFGQIPLREILAVLKYKAPLLGKRVETVKPNFTSKNDYRKIKRGKRLGTRYYASDGVLLDADGNAACNIVLRKHPASTVVPPIYGPMVFAGKARSTALSWMSLKNSSHKPHPLQGGS